MATYAKVLTDASSNQILPYTRAKLVYMDNNTTVETAINNIQNQGGYTLPTASSSTLGGVKIGSNISISSGTISVATGSTYTAGVLSVGSNISVSYGQISLTKTNVTNALGYTPPTTNTVYTLPNATSSTLGGVKIGSNISVSSGTISLSSSNITNALGYTPATTDAIKYRYYFTLPVNSWTSTSSNGYSYYQSYRSLTADNGGSTDLRYKKISAPMSIKTGNATTDETLQANLNIVADGYITCTSSGYVTVYTKEKPSSDITIYIEAN